MNFALMQGLRRKMILEVKTDEPKKPSITCPTCGRTSYHPDDIRYKYCGYCHDWIYDGRSQ